ncbi:MAG: glutaredoxin family protein [Acidimicrobiia bacterium]|nr:glutaredoxin family protein [Acidimicrobiia bacterium]
MQTPDRTPERVVMYTTVWCGICRRLKRALGRHGVEVEEVDIEAFPEHAETIERLTGGYRTVPTVRVGDRYLVNPTADEVLAAARGIADPL